MEQKGGNQHHINAMILERDGKCTVNPCHLVTYIPVNACHWRPKCQSFNILLNFLFIFMVSEHCALSCPMMSRHLCWLSTFYFFPNARISHLPFSFSSQQAIWKIFPTISPSIITNPQCERSMEVIGLLLHWPLGYEFFSCRRITW